MACALGSLPATHHQQRPALVGGRTGRRSRGARHAAGPRGDRGLDRQPPAPSASACSRTAPATSTPWSCAPSARPTAFPRTRSPAAPMPRSAPGCTRTRRLPRASLCRQPGPRNRARRTRGGRGGCRGRASGSAARPRRSSRGSLDMVSSRPGRDAVPCKLDVFAAAPGARAIRWPWCSMPPTSTTHTMQAIASWTNLAGNHLRAAGDHGRCQLPRPHLQPAPRSRLCRPSQHRHRARGAGEPGWRTPRDGMLVQECQAGLLPVRVTGDPRPPVLVGARPALTHRRRRWRGARPDLPPSCPRNGAAPWPRPWSKAGAAGGWRNWRTKPRCGPMRRTGRPSSPSPATATAWACVCSPGHRRRVSAWSCARFRSGVGIDEDPASGAANAAIAAFLDESAALGALGTTYRVSQGREIGRDAILELRIDEQHEVWVGGESRTLIDGVIDWIA